MKGRLLLDVVVREGAAILQLFSGKDQSLLIWGNSLLVLDLSFNIINGVGGFSLDSDGFASQSLDKNLWGNVVVREDLAIFKLFAGKDQDLLIWGDAHFILNPSLDILNGVGRFDLNGEGLKFNLEDNEKKCS